MPSKAIQTVDDIRYFFVCHGLMAWDAQLLSMDAFGNRQGEGMPIAITGLQMRRNGVMNSGLYPTLSKILLQVITLLAKHRENVIDAR